LNLSSTTGYRGNIEFLRENGGTIGLAIANDQFLPNPFQFMTHQSS